PSSGVFVSYTEKPVSKTLPLFTAVFSISSNDEVEASMGLTAEDLMEDPVFVEADTSVEEVAEKVKGEENTLIVRKEGKVVGEVHEHSLLKEIVPQERLDEERVIGVLGLSLDRRYVAETAEDLMNQHEVTVPPDETIEEVAFIMDREDLRSVPVEKEDEIIGVVHENRLVEEV
ncbi:MAG: HPP family protein, partial [Candidatus Nanohalobium sp.]